MYNISRELQGRVRFSFVTYRLSPRDRSFLGFSDARTWADFYPVRVLTRRTWPFPWLRFEINLLRFTHRFGRLARRIGSFDAIMCLNSGMIMNPAISLARRWRVPLIINYRSDWAAEIRPVFPIGLLYRRLSRMARRNLLRADLVLANGNDTAQLVRDAGVPSSRVIALYNGVDTTLFHLRSSGEQRPWPKDQVVFISNSTLRWLKGLEVPMRCLARMPPELRSHARLVYAGRGQWARYAEMAGQLGISERVEYAGELPHTRLADLLRLCDVGLFPGVLGIGMQHASLECLASGLPLIAYLFADYPSLIERERTGILVDISDEKGFQRAMEWVIINRDRLPRMSAWSREKAMHYAWPVIARIFLGALRKAGELH
jgi:glycosyltransferase involved in cell wall biosynthesis